MHICRKYRRLIGKDLRIGTVRSRLEKALLLFVDSGILYCALWVSKVWFSKYPFWFVNKTLLVASASIGLEFASEQEFSTDTVKWRFFDHMDSILDSALIEVIVSSCFSWTIWSCYSPLYYRVFTQQYWWSWCLSQNQISRKHNRRTHFHLLEGNQTRETQE